MSIYVKRTFQADGKPESGLYIRQSRVSVLQGLAVSVLSFWIAGCASKIVVRPVAEAPKLNGIVYALPKTVVTASVTLKRTDEAPGVYAGYAPCFFPEVDPENDITFDKSSKIKLSDASFSSRGVPDPSKVYVIDLRAGWLQKKTLDAQLSEAGLLTSSSAEVKNEALSFTVSTIKSAAAIAGNILSATHQFALVRAEAQGPQLDLDSVRQCASTLDGWSGKLHEKKLFADAVSELKNILQAKDPATQQNLLAASKFSRAKLVFDRMANMIADREQAVASAPNGSTTSDALKEQLAEYNDTLSQYAGYFLGSTTTKIWSPAFDVVPDESEKGQKRAVEYALFRYRGKGDGDDNPVGVCIDKGHPEVIVNKDFAMDAKQCAWMQDGRSASLVVQENLRDALAAVDAAPELKGTRSYFYRIPDSVIVAVDDGGKPLATTQLLLAQWGKIASLPADIGSSRSKYKVELTATTGALTNFSLDSDARLEAADFAGLETASKSITDPIVANKNKLNKLTNDEQILEQQCKINAIKKVDDPNLDCSTVLKKSGS